MAFLTGPCAWCVQVPLALRQDSFLPNVNPAALGNPRVQANHFNNWQHIQTTNPWLLAIGLLLALAEIIASCIIVGQYYNSPCDYPLCTWIIGFSARLIVGLPVAIYRFRNPLAPGTTDAVHSLMQLVHLWGFVWWIVGQVWEFKSQTCGQLVPIVYGYVLVLIVFYYIVMFFPIALITLLCGTARSHAVSPRRGVCH